MHKERLLKLAQHLETGKLSVDKFNIQMYRSQFSGGGTSGCAIGECPTLFPEQWAWTEGDFPYPTLIGSTSIYTREDACVFFEISGQEFHSLFMDDRGGCLHTEDERERPREVVVAEIRRFVELGNVITAIKQVDAERYAKV